MKKIIVFLVLFFSYFLFLPNTYAEDCSGYQLSTINQEGLVVGVQCYADYNEAKNTMNNHTSTSDLVAVIYNNGNIINAKYAIAKLVPGRVIYLYPNSSGSNSYTSVHTSYGTDAAFLDYDVSSNRIKIRISGYSGWTSKDNVTIEPIPTLTSSMIRITVSSSLNVRATYSASSEKIGDLYDGNVVRYYEKKSAEGYTWYRIIYNGRVGWVANDGTYATEYTGSNLNTYYLPYEGTNNLLHYYQYYSSSSYAQSYTNLGRRPNFLSLGTTYYSFDGNYFYTNLVSMLDDYRNNTNVKAVNNNNPYYAYYLYLPTHSKTGYTKDDFNQYIINKSYYRNMDPSVTYVTRNSDATLSWVSGISRDGMSLMFGEGQSYVDAANTYGINALMMFSTSMNESTTGTSAIAFYKKNLFGLGANDSNPVDGARSYNTVRDSIFDFARFTGSGDSSYSNPSKIYYYGSHYGNKGSGMNVNYATDPYWGEKQAGNSYRNDSDFGLQDFNANTIGVTNKSDVNIYKDSLTSSSVIYTLKNNYYNRSVNNIPVIVGEKFYTVENGENIGWYKVYTDIALDENRNIASVDYTFNNSYGYVKEIDLNVSNSQPVINANNITVELGQEPNLRTGVTAIDNEDGSLTDKIVVSGNYDIYNENIYDIKYYVEDKSRFGVTKIVKLTVTRTDNPVIVARDKEVSQYTTFDPKIGITAYDKDGNDITSSIEVITNEVNTNVLGSHKVVYKVTDSLGRTFTKEINVYVMENQKPIINATNKEIIMNTTFDPMQGVTATDYEDGNITNITITSNNLDITTPGEYSITYQVTDSVGSVTIKTIKVIVSEFAYTDSQGDFYFNKMEWSNNKLVVEGSLAIIGMDNISSTNIKYDLMLMDNVTKEIYILSLERWLDHPSRAYIDSHYNYSDSWFKGNIDLSQIPQGEYTIYVRARSNRSQSINLFRNVMGKEMVRKSTDTSTGRGYLFRNNNYKNTYPIELFIRNSGLISTVEPTHQSNMYNSYSSLNITNGFLNMVGTSYNINGNYSSTASIERYVIFESMLDYSKYQFNIGSYSGNEIPLRVSDNMSKVRGWFNTENKINLTTLPVGKYVIYIKTKTGSIDDYGELNDIFMKNIDTSNSITSTYYSGRSYTISLNKNFRFRLELEIRK